MVLDKDKKSKPDVMAWYKKELAKHGEGTTVEKIIAYVDRQEVQLNHKVTQEGDRHAVQFTIGDLAGKVFLNPPTEEEGVIVFKRVIKTGGSIALVLPKDCGLRHGDFVAARVLGTPKQLLERAARHTMTSLLREYAAKQAEQAEVRPDV